LRNAALAGTSAAVETSVATARKRRRQKSTTREKRKAANVLRDVYYNALRNFENTRRPNRRPSLRSTRNASTVERPTRRSRQKKYNALKTY